MPSGPAFLHARFFDDNVAWRYLRRRGFIHTRFVISPPYLGYDPTEKEWDAVQYLIQEWDWDYWGRGAPTRPAAITRLYRARRWGSRVSAGPLRVLDKHLSRLSMWWVCGPKHTIRGWWAKLRGKPWDEEL